MNNKLTLESIEVLDAIARKGSFASAAESLFRVPSAITYTVRKLEEDLGVSLFNRTGHRATLTDAGAELLQEGRHLLHAANELEARVKRIATGIETELTVAMSDALPMETLLDLLQHFYQQNFGTRIKVLNEVYGGVWDALMSGRADISIGAPGDGPAGGGYLSKMLCHLDFEFAVAAHHPLATLPDPLKNQDIVQYRSISAADSSRNLPPRTSGILKGQDVLTMPNMQSKLEAQIKGLGVGYLPKFLAQQYSASGDLIIKQVSEKKHEVPMHLAWRNSEKTMGKAQQWLLKQIEKTNWNSVSVVK
jgi:DNA-binding transcriptional LysR family regulator